MDNSQIAQNTGVTGALKARKIIFVQFVKAHRAGLLYAALLALAFVSLVPTVVPHATSFSIDTTSLLDSAANIFNGLWPAFAIVAGLALGIALVKFIVDAIRHAF